VHKQLSDARPDSQYTSGPCSLAEIGLQMYREKAFLFIFPNFS